MKGEFARYGANYDWDILIITAALVGFCMVGYLLCKYLYSAGKVNTHGFDNYKTWRDPAENDI